MATAKVRDIEMYYEEHGSPDGEPLFLMHGFMGTGNQWAEFLKPLGERYRLIVPDWRGHGRTRNPRGDILHRDAGEDLIAFADGLGVRRAHFAGISSGAMQLFFVALGRPELVRTLTLVVGTYTFDERAGRVVRERAAKMLADRTQIDALEARLAPVHGSGYGGKMVGYWRDSVLRPNELPFTPEDLRKVRCPALVVHGDRDPFFPIDVAVTMYTSIPAAELCVLPNFGHGTPTKFAPHFMAVMLDFLGRNPCAR